MANWRKTCKEFKNVREKIYDEDALGVLRELHKICERYAKLHDGWAEEFRDLADEIYEEIDTECDDDLVCDYYLNQFYDVCDCARIWLDF